MEKEKNGYIKNKDGSIEFLHFIKNFNLNEKNKKHFLIYDYFEKNNGTNGILYKEKTRSANGKYFNYEIFKNENDESTAFYSLKELIEFIKYFNQ